MVKMNVKLQNAILTGFLLAIVGLSYLTNDNFWVVGPVALAAIVYSAWVGWQVHKEDS